jgi:hypothetical protein
MKIKKEVKVALALILTLILIFTLYIYANFSNKNPELPSFNPVTGEAWRQGIGRVDRADPDHGRPGLGRFHFDAGEPRAEAVVSGLAPVVCHVSVVVSGRAPDLEGVTASQQRPASKVPAGDEARRLVELKFKPLAADGNRRWQHGQLQWRWRSSREVQYYL